MRLLFLFFLLVISYSCKDSNVATATSTKEVPLTSARAKPSLTILGTVQDAGSPHIGCEKDCCKALFKTPDTSRKVVSLGLVDPEYQKTFLFEATPDITEQLKILKHQSSFDGPEIPNGIFLTHAHIGHYTGLMYLGKEAKNTDSTAVFAMPKMKEFLGDNGPWSQLVSDGNVSLKALENNQKTRLTPNLNIIPLVVPHRDEYSETVGYKIIGPTKKVLFIPDIDKWEKWETDIVQAIMDVDYALLDGSFYDGEEINHRDISEIPHPFVIESMLLFENLPQGEKEKIYFIHFNHTNPLLDTKSPQAKRVLEKGFNIAEFKQVFQL